MTDLPPTSERPLSPTCLVVPCYNEARRLDLEQFRTFLSLHPDILVLFVDDGSSDNTAPVLQHFCSACEHSAHLLRLAQNRGKAEAVRRGILHALDHFHPAVVGFWDADLATPLASVPRFLAVLAERPGIEMIFGARVQLLGRHVQRSAVRHYLGRIFATTVSSVIRLPIYDTQCGAKLFRVGPQSRAIFADPFLSRWVFDVEILARYQKLFLDQHHSLARVIYEYPLETWVDVAGSKVHPGDFLIAFWDILRIHFKYFA